MEKQAIILKGSIFLSVKELMILSGKDLMSTSMYESTRREHQAIRDGIVKNKRKLTVKEYCKHEGISFEEVAEVLNRYR